MLLRASRLRETIDPFIHKEAQNSPTVARFRLSNTEWQKIEYLIDLTLPFAYTTTVIGQSTGPTIHLCFGFYNTLFDVLDVADAKLDSKTHTL